MINTRIIPVLLIEKSKLVKSVCFKSNNYVGDPLNAIRVFSNKYIDEIIVIDITQEKNKAINFSLIQDMAEECFSPLTYGGGISSLDDASRLFSIGIEKICINSLFRKDINIVKDMIKAFGSCSVIHSIDLYKFRDNYFIYSYDRFVKINPFKKDIWQYLKYVDNFGFGEVFINFVNKDGTFSGYDFEFIKLLGNRMSLPVTVCGGCGSFEELYNLSKYSKISGIAAGSVFVYRSKSKGVLINYPSIEDIETEIGTKI